MRNSRIRMRKHHSHALRMRIACVRMRIFYRVRLPSADGNTFVSPSVPAVVHDSTSTAINKIKVSSIDMHLESVRPKAVGSPCPCSGMHVLLVHHRQLEWLYSNGSVFCSLSITIAYLIYYQVLFVWQQLDHWHYKYC